MIVLPTMRWGGAEIHLISLAKELSTLGVEIIFAVVRPSGMLLNTIPEHIKVFPLLSNRAARILGDFIAPLAGRYFIPTTDPASNDTSDSVFITSSQMTY